VQIAACVTYRLQSGLLAPFSDRSRVAPHVVGMLLAVVAHVFGPRSVLCLLLRISTAEIVGVLGSPLQIGLPLLLAATLWPATGHLPLLEPRMGMKPTTTERASPSREHAVLLQRTA